MTRIALSAGHYNSNLGDETERRYTGPIYVALVDILRGFGYDVLELTPIVKGVAKNFPGTLTNCAKQVVTRAQQGWKADLFLEIHAESNPLGDSGRGPFVIYPDWYAGHPDPTMLDRDVIIKDALGPAIANSIAKAFSIPIRGNGVMSERQTAVGSGNNRLGIFKITESIKYDTRRGLVEVMRFNQINDYGVMQRRNFVNTCAGAIALAILNHYEDVKIDLAKVDPAFYAAYLASGGMWMKNRLTPGLVVTPKFIWQNREVQLFERAGVWSTDGGITTQWLLQPEYEAAHTHYLNRNS